MKMDIPYLLNDPSGFGLRFVEIPRHHYGFGFTLRHFIVYPPELYVNETDNVQRNRNHKPMVKVTEPVDTIFVKSVVENGPASRAGLCVGDRIVSVNGQTIFGKSYDQVVQLIQKSEETLRLEVSPKQYDTLQLFFEETAYRPETNQRPYSSSTNASTTAVSSKDSIGFNHQRYYHAPSNPNPNERKKKQLSNNSSSDSFFLSYHKPVRKQNSMSSPYPNSSNSNPQLFSHLPRPTPYKSSSVWSSSGSSQQHQPKGIPAITSSTSSSSRPPQIQQSKSQPQTYYPFNQDLQSSQSFGAASLWKIKEEPNSGAKSAESILAGNDCKRGGDYGEYCGSAQRTGSVECLTGGKTSAGNVISAGGGNSWTGVGPDYNYHKISTDGNTMDQSSQRRESTGSMPSTNAHNAMVVTMTSTNSKMQQQQGPYQFDYSDSGSSGGGSNSYGCLSNYPANGQGYELKMADRIRRSCEQKEEFLKRPPNQPMSWAPLQSAPPAFPKELYAQPQKFEKIPWPPAHIVPTVTSTKAPVQSCSGTMSPNNYELVKNVNNISVISVQHNPNNFSQTRTKTVVSPNVEDYVENRAANNFQSQVQSSPVSHYDARSISPSWLEYGPRNRTTIVGSRKLHCDPPPDWNPDLSTLTYAAHEEDEEDSGGTSSNRENRGIQSETKEGPVEMLYSASKAPPLITTVDVDEPSWNYMRANDQLKGLPSFYHPRDMSGFGVVRNSAYSPVSPLQFYWPTQGFIDAEEVNLRKRDLDLDQDNERLVRRVSYLKATSSPIDMDRKSASPTSPTRSCDILGKTTTPIADGGRRRSMANKLSAEFLQKGRIIRLKQFFEERTQPPSIFKFSIDSPSSEYRGFGSFLGDKSPDSSEITREGQIHFKIRVGESKRGGGYNRSWRQGWVQIRRSGCLYISKERLSRDSVTITEDSVIIALSLRGGVTVEQAEDYSKRKHVMRIKTSYTSEDITNISSSEVSYTNANAHPPSHSTAVEILIQAEDSNDYLLWLQSLHTQLENNNYCNGNASSFKGIFFGPEFCPKQKSLLTSFLPSPPTSGGQASHHHHHHQPTSDKNAITTTTNINNNSLHPVVTPVTPNSLASPKTKTWKRKVARQWKKVHNIIDTGGDSKGSSPYTCAPPVGATFGINLDHCPPGEKNPFVPRVIEYAIEVVESKGIDMVGLYRIPGNNASVATLTDRLNKGESPDPIKDPKWLDVHVVASLIKSFLRRLPDPLLTDERYQAFIVAADDPDPLKCREKMQYLITDLPDSNYETLRAVIMHLKTVAEHGENNRMDARNLAIVFGPTIVRTAEENVTSMVADMKNQCKIVEMLVSNADELFKESRLTSDESLQSEFSNPVLSLPNLPLSENIQKSPNTEISTDNLSTSAGPSYLPISVQVYSNSENPNALRNKEESMLSSPPVQTIQSEIRASVLKAAMRKASQKSKNPSIQNVYGLPTKPLKKSKPIDDAGFIRSYAGLNEETEQRVRNFELETRAMLSREDRSPHSSAVNIGTGKPAKGMDDFRINRLKLDDELQKAKLDLENEDIYDQLADNPSSIVHHRDRGNMPMFPVTPGGRNLSSSSISSSNSNSTVPSSQPATSIGIQKLGPVPFKSPFVPQGSLPPKPPQLHSSGSSLIGPTSVQSKSSLSSSSSPVSPLRRVSSMDRFGAGDFDTNNSQPPSTSKIKGADVKFSPLPFVPKHFGGSLDSLKDIANGSDLVTSLTRTFDKKLQNLRKSNENTSTAFSSLSSSNNMDSQDEIEEGDHGEVFEKPEKSNMSKNESPTLKQISEEPVKEVSSEKRSFVPRVNGFGKRKDRRRNSMIERRFHSDDPQNGTGNVQEAWENGSYYRNPSLHRFSGDAWPQTTNLADHQVLTKEAKTATNKLTRDCRRRHSLSGTGDILSAVFLDKTKQCSVHDVDRTGAVQCQEKRTTLSSDAITTALTRAGILESHV